LKTGAARLFLFDIDGTLITSGGAGEASLCEAMRTRFGVDEDMGGIHLPGNTDARIASELLRKHGLPETPENAAALLDEYLFHLERRISAHEGRVMPGIIDLLHALEARSDAVLALLTGNVERGARIKLSHYRVWHHFEFGAFADDHGDRNQLGHFARRKALDRRGVDFPPDRIVVIGDTPRDIECGRAIGAKTVAIATGHFSLSELECHSPDALFENLADTPTVVERLFAV
jgi:phosphoglycolate phosphatase